MIERLRESRTFYIVVSIVLAIIFWLYVRAEVNPEQNGIIRNVPVELTGESVLASQGLAVAQVSDESIDFQIRAPASVLTTLNRKNVTAIVDVSKCSEGDNILYTTPKVAGNVNYDGTTWVGQTPEMVTVRVEKLDSKVYPIEFQLRGSVADGYQVGTAAINPETVTISGPVEQVSQVSKVVAVLEVDEMSEQFAGSLPLTLMNMKGEVLSDLDVTMDTESAYVVLPIVTVKEINLTVNLLDGGGATSSDADYEITPKTIIVAGPSEAMEGLNEISLGSVDLAKVIGSKVISMPISLSPLLENVSGISSATVTVEVNDLATRSLEVDNISLINVPSGYRVSVVTQERSIVIRGHNDQIREVDASQIRIVADLGGDITTVGTYPVPVKVYLDGNNSVGVVGEYTIVIKISSR